MELNSNDARSNTERSDATSSRPPKFVLQPGTYDYTAMRTVSKPTNVFESTVHLIKGCLGGGIMGIHEAYMKAGLWTSLIFTIIFGVYITYCVHIIVKAAQILYGRLHLTTMSYPDVFEAAVEVGPFPKLRKFSRVCRYAVDVIICIDLFGSCCVYMIIIAKTIDQLVENSKGIVDEKPDTNSVRLYILIILIPVVLLCMIRTLKYLAPFSLLADVFIVVCVAATVFYAIKVAPELSSVPSWKDFMGFFEFCGVVVFSMEGVGVALPIENNMKNPNHFPIVLCAGMVVVVIFVGTVGFFGYWGWGDSAKSPVTLNFPFDIFPIILKFLMALMIYVTFALNFWAPFNLVWYYLERRYDASTHWIWERVYRAIFVAAITIIAITFPNIGNLMGFLGAFCLSNMGFIFPATIELLVYWEEPGLGKLKWRLWKNIAIIILGVLLLISSTYSNVQGLIKNM